MSILKVQAVRSDGIYRKIMEAPVSKKNDIYRYEMMKPFEKDVYKRQVSSRSNKRAICSLVSYLKVVL